LDKEKFHAKTTHYLDIVIDHNLKLYCTGTNQKNKQAIADLQGKPEVLRRQKRHCCLFDGRPYLEHPAGHFVNDWLDVNK
jgi:hypothetical protein